MAHLARVDRRRLGHRLGLDKGVVMNIKYQTMRIARITAPMTEREQVFDWVIKNGYRIRRSGPKSISGMKVDATKLLVVAEKRIK